MKKLLEWWRRQELVYLMPEQGYGDDEARDLRRR